MSVNFHFFWSSFLTDFELMIFDDCLCPSPSILWPNLLCFLANYGLDSTIAQPNFAVSEDVGEHLACKLGATQPLLHILAIPDQP